MAKKKRIKAPAITAPGTKDEASTLLGEIGDLQRDLVMTETEMNDRLSKIKKTYEDEAALLNERINEKFEALHVWAEANKTILLKGKAKTARLSTGEISWRSTPPSVRVTKVEAVIKKLKAAGLFDLVRTKEEVNKEAVLEEPQRVKGITGITVSNKEEFVAKPFESLIEKAKPVKKTEKKIKGAA